MLQDAEQNDFQDIVSWNSNGASFKVHKPLEFSDKVMPKYFKNQRKYKSFQRQLNLYGFTRIHYGMNKGNYYHREFRRPQEPSHTLLARKLPTTTKQIIASSCTPTTSHNVTHSNISLSMSAFDMQALMDFEAEQISSVLWDKAERVADSFLQPKLPLLQSFFETNEGKIKVPLWDLIGVDEKQASDMASSKEKLSSNALTRHSFPFMLHDMLNDTESNNFAHIVSWESDGMSFKVHRQDEFVEKIMPLYFDQSKYESFRRQLNHYSFSRVKTGSNKGRYFHASFVKGARFLCNHIPRQPNCKG
jgi:hypothetical protein